MLFLIFSSIIDYYKILSLFPILYCRSLQVIYFIYSRSCCCLVTKLWSTLCDQLFVTPWIIACQVSLSMGFPRQEHWSGLPSPSEVPLNTGIESTCQCRRHRFNPCVRKVPWRRKWQTTPVFLHGKSHGQRNLAGYSP